jgi:hypothetical protein
MLNKPFEAERLLYFPHLALCTPLLSCLISDAFISFPQRIVPFRGYSLNLSLRDLRKSELSGPCFVGLQAFDEFR